MQFTDLDNKIEALTMVESEPRALEIQSVYSKEDIRRAIEERKIKYSKGTDNLLGLFKGKGGIKATFKNEKKSGFWIVSMVYACRYFKKGSETAYTIPIANTVEKVWVNGGEVNLAKKETKISDIVGKISNSVSIYNIKLEGLDDAVAGLTKKALGDRDKSVSASKNVSLPDVIEEVVEAQDQFLIYDDKNAEVTGKRFKNIVATLQSKKTKPLKSTPKSKVILEGLKEKAKGFVPTGRPVKVTEQTLKIAEFLYVQIPYYGFEVEENGKKKFLTINPVTLSEVD